MANPTVSASLDKTTYAPGDPMTLTVQYADADNTSTDNTITITGTDQSGNNATVTVKYTVKNVDNVTLSVSDSSGKSWPKVSDSNGVAKFQGTA